MPSLGLQLGLQYWASSGVAQRLLDAYAGSEAAYSLETMSSSFAGADLILARRSSDNAELGFTETEIKDGTLEAWAGVGDAFVKTWYDQSGNGNHATQATAADQFIIVESGVRVAGSGLKADGDATFGQHARIPINTAELGTVFTLIWVGTVYNTSDSNTAYQPVLGTVRSVQGYNTGAVGLSVIPVIGDVQFANEQDATTEETVRDITTLGANDAAVIAASYSSGGVTLSVNGVQTAGTITSPVLTGTIDFCLGGGVTGSGLQATRAPDALHNFAAIYTRALSAGELTSITAELAAKFDITLP